MDGKRQELQAVALEHGFASQAKAIIDDDISKMRQALAASRSQVASPRLTASTSHLASQAAQLRSCSALAARVQAGRQAACAPRHTCRLAASCKELLRHTCRQAGRHG